MRNLLLICFVLLNLGVTCPFRAKVTLVGVLPEVEVICKLPSKEDLELISRVVEIAAPDYSQPFHGKMAVANVITNRSDNRGKDIEEIIHAKEQFDEIPYLYIREPSELSRRAAFLVLTGTRVLPKEVEFFHNKKASTDISWVNTMSKYEYVTWGDHTFCFNPKLIKYD